MRQVGVSWVLTLATLVLDAGAAVPMSAHLHVHAAEGSSLQESSFQQLQKLDKQPHQLDNPTHQPRQLDIVLVHYAEEVRQCAEFWQRVVRLPLINWLSPRFFVYTHGSNATLAELQQSWFGNETVGEAHRLDNFGRESHPYFFHILRHYGHFPAFLLFHQALPEKGCNELFMNRIQRLRPNTGMLSLGDASVCTCAQCWGENPVQFKEIWAMARQEFCSPEERFATFLKGAFIVASRRVMAVPHRTYSALYQYLEAPDGHWLHKEKGSYGKETHNTSSPTLGHIIERSWNALFDCLDPGVVHPDYCTVKCVPEKDCGVESCPPAACQCLEAPGRFDWIASST